MSIPLDRDALARRVFDAVICSPHEPHIEAIETWLCTIEGMGGYIACSASALETSLPPTAAHLAAVGEAIEKAAKIAGILANDLECQLLLANRKPSA
jgi:hypothetical protein